MNLKDKVKEAIRLQGEVRKLDTRKSNLVTEVWDSIESLYPILLNNEEKGKFTWNWRSISSELQLVARSMMKKDTDVIYLNNEVGEVSSLCLTAKHGVKYPRCHGGISIIPYYLKPEKISFRKGVYSSSQYNVDFLKLREVKGINNKGLNKFLFFLKKSIKVWKEYQEIQADLKKNFLSLNTSLSKYSGLDQFKEFVDREVNFRKPYKEIKGKLIDFGVSQNSLIEEMKEYNKAFRILLTLKEDAPSYRRSY